jgi:hypothetical protein
MRRSLASQYRVKAAHHLLNIVALKREMDTYNVEGLLKAASTGHSKEACLKYAALHTALLFEKRAIEIGDEYGQTPSRWNRTPAPENPRTYPGATPTAPLPAPAAKMPSRGFAGLGLGGLGSSISNAASGVGNYLSGGPKLIGDMATGTANAVRNFPYGSPESKPVPNANSMSLGSQQAQIAKNQVENDAGQRSKRFAAANAETDSAVPSFADNERVPSGFGGDPATTAAKAVAKTPAKPTPASVIPKPAATGGADPFAANSAAYAKAQGAAKPARAAKPVNPDTFNDITGKSTPAAKPSRDPFAANSAAYAKAQGAAQSAGRQQATNIASGVGNFMSNFGKTTANAVNSASNAMGGATPPSTGGYAASQSAYGASPAAASAPAQNDYDSQIAESQRYSDASKQQGDEDAYMKSIEPTAPTYKASPPAESSPVAQEAVAQKSQPQQPQGRRTPVRNVISRFRGR